MKLLHSWMAAALCIVCVTFAIIPQPTLAAAHRVDTADNLIAAINNANSNPDADTILLTANITLTSAAEIGFMGNDTGLPPITSTITIEGQGHTITRSGSAPSFRILDVTNTGTLTLYNLTISGGQTEIGSNYAGGGLFNAGTLTLINSAVLANSATWGGGLYVQSGTVDISNSTISNNYTTASSNGAGDSNGGGIVFKSGNLSITDSVISNNVAVTDGGGIFSESITLGTVMTIDHSIISGNTAGRMGGGILYGSSTSSATISNSTFSGNSAKSGGGGELVGDFHLSNSTFSSNTATETGGGAYLGVYYADLIVNHLTFVGNTAPQGGGVYVDNMQDLSSPPAAIWDSIIVQSGVGGNCYVLGRTLTSDAADLADDASCSGFTNIASPPQNLNIGSLADNGGNTKTFAITSPSPALDSATGSCTGTDQRGVRRGIDVAGGLNLPQTGDCDVGAFEAGGVIHTMQFTPATDNVFPGAATYHVPVILDSALAQGETVKGYVWVSGGTAVAGIDYVPFGVKTVNISAGNDTGSVDVTLLNTSSASGTSIILSFATEHGPGFSGPARLGTQLTHHINILPPSPANAAPVRNYFTTKTPTLTWNRVSQAVRYEVEISTSDTFSSAAKYDAGNVLAYTWPSELPNGLYYYWRVRACTAASAASCGGWSAPDSFVVFVP